MRKKSSAYDIPTHRERGLVCVWWREQVVMEEQMELRMLVDGGLEPGQETMGRRKLLGTER